MSGRNLCSKDVLGEYTTYISDITLCIFNLWHTFTIITQMFSLRHVLDSFPAPSVEWMWTTCLSDPLLPKHFMVDSSSAVVHEQQLT